MNKTKYRIVAAVLAIGIAASCSDGSGETAKKRDYWPTIDWQTSSPERQKMNASRLSEIDAYAKKKMPGTTSILIIRNGYLVYERYSSKDERTTRKLWSATKSITSIVAGIAAHEGRFDNINSSIIEMLPELATDTISPEIKEITIHHLLTMTSGLSSGSSLYGAPSFNTVKELLKVPLRAEPGSEFNYSDLSPQLISILITKLTGLSLFDYAKQRLFKPLGITNVEWADAETGYSDGANGLFMTARDMAKLGYLYLNSGKWDKEQIVADDWIRESTKLQVEYQKDNKPKEQALNIDYGYFWWVNQKGKHPLYWAHGYGGQTISIIPDLDLVVVITSQREGMAEYDHLLLIRKHIVPASR